ncbi:MAG TPA: hypothetical protein DIU35_07265 [Candidatus Latescibacteria bacterium]|nr:hypothetical protein [Candidatus Latescibacterota bacterium]|tara:strand:+ start:7213 stop:8058 length:846 start_codon:yes stop_codon:yes gene_type:complete
MEQHIDLHLHSTCSDGTFSPEEVAWRAIEEDLAVISLTDHDSIEGVEAAQKEGEKLGLEVIPGTELSTQADGKDIHILGYFIQGDHPGLIDCLDTCRDERKNRAERIVKKLNSMGLRIPFEQVLAKAGDGAIGRPHVADVLVEEGFVFSANEAFYKYLGYAKPAYEPKFTLDPAEAIQVIHSAGGLACLAHPGLYGRDDLIPGLVEDGLDGIEVRHTKHGPAEIKRYTEVAEQFNLLPSGGSDCHGDGRGSSVIGTVDVPRSYVDGLSTRAQEMSSEVRES